jgi:hypothetical protein
VEPRQSHRPKAFALLAALSVFGGCGTHAVARMIRVNATSACQPQASDLATLTAGGDFPADPSPPTVTVSAVGLPLALEPATRGLVVNTVSSGSPASFWGVTEMPSTGDVDVLVWSTLGPCKVTTPAVAVQGESLGLIDGRHALLNAGDELPFLFDLSTGHNVRLTKEEAPQASRTLATITSFGPGRALLAGGVQNASGVSVVRGDAEVFTLGADGSSGSFVSTVLLAQPRAQAGALVLPDGDTLLVGGLLTAAPIVLNSTMELVSPTQEGTPMALGVTLQTARTSPTVMRLTDGQIFVGGGFDATGQPVSTGEWFDSGLTTPLGTTDLAPPMMGGGDGGVTTTPTQYLYAPLEGGAVLAVIAGAGGNNVVVLPACDASSTPCSTHEPGVALMSMQPLGTNAVLLPGANGAPVLWTGTSWMRFDAWAAGFTAIAAPADGGTTAPGPSGLASLAADPGLAVWVAGDGSLYGLRYDTRGPFVNDTLIGTLNTAPDHVNSPALVTRPSAGWQLHGVPGLSVANGAKVFLTDATFEDVRVSATMLDAWAGVIFRDETGCEYDIGTPSTTSSGSCSPVPCPFPDFGAMGAASVLVQRTGAHVSYTINPPDGPTTQCADPGFGASARLSVGIYGPDASVLNLLEIVRGP